jgi:hypothetical protein
MVCKKDAQQFPANDNSSQTNCKPAIFGKRKKTTSIIPFFKEEKGHPRSVLRFVFLHGIELFPPIFPLNRSQKIPIFP